MNLSRQHKNIEELLANTAASFPKAIRTAWPTRASAADQGVRPTKNERHWIGDGRMKKTGRVFVLTVKNKPEAVVTEAIKGIRRGLVQAKKGMGRSVDEVFDSIEKDAARDALDFAPQPNKA
jgi:hypothetical protein